MKYVAPVAELFNVEAVSVVLASTETEATTAQKCPNETEEFEEE